MFALPIFLLLAHAAGQAENPNRIPIQYANRVCVLPVEVNGKKMRFLLDTGSYGTFLLRPAKDLGIEDEAASATLKLGNHTWNNVKLDLLNAPDLRKSWVDLFDGKLDGMIGVNLLKDIGFGLDVKNRSFQIFENNEKEFPDFWATKDNTPKDDPFQKPLPVSSCPLLKSNIGSYLSPIRVDDVTHFVTLDTGAMNSQFPAPEVDSMTSKQVGRVYENVNVYGKGSTFSYQVSKVQVAGIGVRFPLVFIRSVELNSPGYLGMEFLSATRAVWDYPHSKIYFQPNPDRNLEVVPELETTSDVTISPYGDVIPLPKGKTYLLPDWLTPLHPAKDLRGAQYGGFLVDANRAANPVKPVSDTPRKVYKTFKIEDDVYMIFSDGSIRIVHKDGTASWKYQPPGSLAGTQ